MTILMLMSSWQSHCESSPDSRDKCRAAPGGRRLLDQANLRAASRPKPHHYHHRGNLLYYFESWYSFYCPTEARRLSSPRCSFYLPADSHPSQY